MAAALGNTVHVHFVGKVGDGREFESTLNAQPMRIQLGKGEIMPAIENGIVGMEQGDKKTLNLSSADAFGERDDDFVYDIPRADIPDEVTLEPGAMLSARSDEGEEVRMIVLSVDDEKVTVDGNHPLAGHDLIIDLELVGID